MESQNVEQLIQNSDNELTENLDLPEAIAVTENNDTLENNSWDLQSSVEPSLDGFNDGSVAQQFAGLPNQRTQKLACWDELLKKWVDCPPVP